jgi:hypothetical protein
MVTLPKTSICYRNLHTEKTVGVSNFTYRCASTKESVIDNGPECLDRIKFWEKLHLIFPRFLLIQIELKISDRFFPLFAKLLLGCQKIMKNLVFFYLFFQVITVEL